MFLIPLPLLCCAYLSKTEQDSLLLLEDIYAWINHTVKRDTEIQMLSQELHRGSLAPECACQEHSQARRAWRRGACCCQA